MWQISQKARISTRKFKMFMQRRSPLCTFQFPVISNMLCEASVLARWGVGGGGNRVVKITLPPCF